MGRVRRCKRHDAAYEALLLDRRQDVCVREEKGREVQEAGCARTPSLAVTYCVARSAARAPSSDPPPLGARA